MADEDKTEESTEQKKPSLIKKILLPLVLTVIAAGGTYGGLSYFGMISSGEETMAEAGEEGEDGEMADVESAPATAGTPVFFFSFYPDMLVNFTSDGNPHYLKVTIDVMSRDEEAIKGVEEYHSILRNNILKLFQQVKYETVKGTEGMESMQAIALEEIKRVLKQYHGNNSIEGVYFTSFVVQ